MLISTYLIDTFTSVAFRGNPTAVCIIDKPIASSLMLSIAKELNLPVTAFINKQSNSIEYQIRYYTTTTEIPACGHATLASAFALREKVSSPTFVTENNVTLQTEEQGDVIMMSYPSLPYFEVIGYDETLASLSINEYKSMFFCEVLETLFIELHNPDELKQIQPDYKRLIYSSDIIKEVVITSISDNEQYDYLLRSFCPWIGIDEDPVTGSVHSVLGKFWGDRLNKKSMQAYQASARGGSIFIDLAGDKVKIGGEAVMVMSATIDLDKISSKNEVLVKY